MAFQIANQTFYFVIVGSEHNTNKQTKKVSILSTKSNYIIVRLCFCLGPTKCELWNKKNEPSLSTLFCVFELSAVQLEKMMNWCSASTGRIYTSAAPGSHFSCYSIHTTVVLNGWLGMHPLRVQPVRVFTAVCRNSRSDLHDNKLHRSILH